VNDYIDPYKLSSKPPTIENKEYESASFDANGSVCVSYRVGEDTFNNKLSPTKIDRPYEAGGGTPAAGDELPYGAVASSQKSHGLVSIDPAAPLQQHPIQNLIKITESE
jgi:hypothetical protein